MCACAVLSFKVFVVIVRFVFHLTLLTRHLKFDPILMENGRIVRRRSTQLIHWYLFIYIYK